jgi:hypothetical protein
MKPLTSPSDVIDALGGTAATARIVGKSLQAVSNWRRHPSGRLPPETFLRLMKALRAGGYDAAPELWGIDSSELKA